LISEEIWKHYKLEEGSVIQNAEFQWTKMSENWSRKFISSVDLMRGCLTLSSNQIKVTSYLENLVVHPFTIIEHIKEGIPSYDFMYFSVNKDWDLKQIQGFLKDYKTRYDGKYIFEPDPNETIYGAEYMNPKDFLNRGQDTLNIIEARIEEQLKDQDNGVIDRVYNFLCNTITNETELVRMSRQQEINIPPIMWRGQQKLFDSIKAFLADVIEKKKVTPLYDLLLTEYPDSFITKT